MNNLQDFTSLPPHEEAQFVVFERTTQEGLHKAFMAALITAVGITVATLVLYFGFAPPKKAKHADPQGQTKQAAPAAEAAKPDK